jgi:hypothetical protein
MNVPENVKQKFLHKLEVNSKKYTQNHLEKVMKDNPRLTAYGFGSFDPSGFDALRESLKADLGGFQAACVYLTYMKKTPEINMDISSYGYKHRVEDMGYHYVYNGSFIAAAIHMKFKLDTRSDTPNAAFNIYDPLYEKYGW